MSSSNQPRNCTLRLAPSAGFEPAHPAPEADALSPELRGLVERRLHASRDFSHSQSPMTTEQRLTDAVAAALESLGIPVDPQQVQLVRPARLEHGDWSTNVALVVAKAAGRPPRELADDLAAALSAAGLEEVESGSRSRARVSSISGWRRRGCTTRWRTSSPRARSPTPRPISEAASGSRSSSCPPTRPALCTWATAGSAPTATPSGGS